MAPNAVPWEMTTLATERQRPRRHPTGVRPNVLLLSVLVLTACGSDPAEERWSNRTPLATCGEVQVETGNSLEEATRLGFSCLRDSVASHRGAELTVTYGTTEGDPITAYFRVTPDGSFEVYTDATKDTFGSQRWEYLDCGHTAPAPSPRC